MSKPDYYKASLDLHKRLKGKLEVNANTKIETKHDLSVVYSPGVAAPCEAIAENPVVFALANPIPEILPEKAKQLGVAIIATGRSDYPNQVNNVLAFPGIFKGALEVKAPRITADMKIAASKAIAECQPNPTAESIIPNALNMNIADKVAKAIIDNYNE